MPFDKSTFRPHSGRDLVSIDIWPGSVLLPMLSPQNTQHKLQHR